MNTVDWSSLQPLELIRLYGFTDHAEQLAAVVRPTIVARVTPTDSESILLGASRFGGEPELPVGTVWPTNAGRALLHVAQLYLPDLAPFDVDGVLPGTGWLCFWILCEDPKEDSQDDPIFKVLYIDEGSELHRTSSPVPRDDGWNPHLCRAEFGTTRKECALIRSSTIFRLTLAALPRDTNSN